MMTSTLTLLEIALSYTFANLGPKHLENINDFDKYKYIKEKDVYKSYELINIL